MLFRSEYVRVQNGNISVLQASSDAIHAKTVQVEGGNLQLKASSNGIEAQTGFIKISDCVIDVESENDAIKASYEGTSTEVDPYIEIISGSINILTTKMSAKGMKAVADIRIDGGDINIQAISTDCKGIDSNTNIIINGGEINVYSSEDCINGKESITINGGKIYCNSVSNDGIRSEERRVGKEC